MEQRTTEETKELIKRAARLQGVSVSEFVLEYATAAAMETLDRFAVTRLDECDADAFMRAFEDTKPNVALVDLMSLSTRSASSSGD